MDSPHKSIDIGERIKARIEADGLIRGGIRYDSGHLHLDWHPCAAEQLEAEVVDILTDSEQLARLHARSSTH